MEGLLCIKHHARCQGKRGMIRHGPAGPFLGETVSRKLIGKYRCSVSLLMRTACGRQAASYLHETNWHGKESRGSCREPAFLTARSNWNLGLGNVEVPSQNTADIFSEFPLLPVCSSALYKVNLYWSVMYIQEVLTCTVWSSFTATIPVQPAPRSTNGTLQPLARLFHAPLDYSLTTRDNRDRLILPGLYFA